jgi:hypothetical protein
LPHVTKPKAWYLQEAPILAGTAPEAFICSSGLIGETVLCQTIPTVVGASEAYMQPPRKRVKEQMRINFIKATLAVFNASMRLIGIFLINFRF